MDVLRWNRAMLSLLGFDFHCSSDKVGKINPAKWTLILKLMKKLYCYSIIVLMFMGGIVIPFSIVFADGNFIVRIILASTLFHYSGAIILMIKLSQTLEAVTKALSRIWRYLDEKEMKLVQHHDKRGVIVKHLFSSFPAMIGVVFYHVSELSFDMFELFFSKDWQKHLKVIALVFSFTSLILTGHFYSTVETVAKIYAEHCKNMISQILRRKYPDSCQTVDPFSLVQKSLDRYFLFVEEINDYLGIIPLCMFLCLFTDIIITIIFVTMFHQAKVLVFIAITSCAGIQVIGVLSIIQGSQQTRKVIEEAVALAEKVARSPLFGSASLSQMESRRSLTLYLHSIRQQSLVPFSAQSVFSLDPSIVLCFFNSVVPFTVMFITTIAQINRDNNKSLNVFSNNTIISS